MKEIPIRKGIQKLANMLPGIALCLLLTFIGSYMAELLGVLLIALNVIPEGSASPVSGIFVAILSGALIRNTIGLHSIFTAGVQYSLKKILRFGIILLGIRLSFIEALKLGGWGLPLIIICISSGIIITLYFTKRLKQSKSLGTLIAGGTGICGVTAIMTMAPVIKAKDNEISYAVANITIFGLIGMLFYPYLANIFFDNDPIKTGLFLGTSIHDTAQVTGAALMYAQMYGADKVVDVATVTKLTRNLFIIAVIPVVSYLFYKQKRAETDEKAIPKWYQLVPLFVVGFLFMALLRSIGDYTLTQTGTAFGFLETASWESIYSSLSTFGSKVLLGAAMAGVGLSTDFKIFKGLGMKPFYIGSIAAVSIGVISAVFVSLFGHFIHL